MDCLKIRIDRTGAASLRIERKGGDARVHINRIGGGARVRLNRIGGSSISSERMGGLKMTAYLVCDVGRQKYLRVTPDEPIWIDVGIDGIFTIRSNTEWIVD